MNGKGKSYTDLELYTNYVIVDEGNFLDGQLNGYGKTSVNGKIFLKEGIFKNGEIVKTINSTESNDIPLGRGIFYDIDFDKIPLKFRKNKEAINIYLSYNVNKYDVKYSDKWDKEKFNGYGKIYYNGNLRYEGFFYKNELIMIIKQYDNYENLKAMAIESSYNNIDTFIFSGHW